MSMSYRELMGDIGPKQFIYNTLTQVAPAFKITLSQSIDDVIGDLKISKIEPDDELPGSGTLRVRGLTYLMHGSRWPYIMGGLKGHDEFGGINEVALIYNPERQVVVVQVTGKSNPIQYLSMFEGYVFDFVNSNALRENNELLKAVSLSIGLSMEEFKSIDKNMMVDRIKKFVRDEWSALDNQVELYSYAAVDVKNLY